MRLATDHPIGMMRSAGRGRSTAGMTSAGATGPTTAAPSAPPDPLALLRSRSHLRLLVLAGEVTYDTEPLEPPPDDRILVCCSRRSSELTLDL
jgi:hypothetical protein